MTTKSLPNLLSRLYLLHSTKSAEAIFAPTPSSKIRASLVTDPKSGEPFWPSYLPFVGTRYPEHRILLIATSQNLAHWLGTERWEKVSGTEANPLFRMYPVHGEGILKDPELIQTVRWNEIPIAPMEEGIFPALAGLWIQIQEKETLLDFQEISQRVAVTNFYKHSLMKKGRNKNAIGKPAQDLLGAEGEEFFLKESLVHYLLPEIEILSPRTIIIYKSLAPFLEKELSKRTSPPRILKINDPSWIKQGMTGKAKAPDGEWYKKMINHPLPRETQEVLDQYIPQMGPFYRSKESSVRVYLSIYAQEFAGTFSQQENPNSLQRDREEITIKVPLFPRFDELRTLLPIWEGWPRSAITHLRTTIGKIRGTPQSPVDWLDPESWIPERLEGTDRKLAQAIWEGSQGLVNPRYVQGHWLLANNYGFFQEDPHGSLSLTEVGRDFVHSPLGKAEREVDRSEGLLKILSIAADLGAAPFRDFLPDWKEHLTKHSNYRTQNTINDSLRRRLNNLIHRGFIDRNGSKYSITPKGMDYLEKTEETALKTDSIHKQIRALARKQDKWVRESIHEALQTLDPILFEILIKQLLQEMGYSNVEVTSPTGDGGVDVIAEIELGITSVREVVQAKRHKRRIQRKDLDALRGCLHRFEAVRGTIITTAQFSRGTRNAAFEPGAAPITLIDGTKLVELLIEHGIGVQKKSIELLKFSPQAFSRAELTELEE